MSGCEKQMCCYPSCWCDVPLAKSTCGKLNGGVPCAMPAGTRCPDCAPARTTSAGRDALVEAAEEAATLIADMQPHPGDNRARVLLKLDRALKGHASVRRCVKCGGCETPNMPASCNCAEPSFVTASASDPKNIVTGADGEGW